MLVRRSPVGNDRRPKPVRHRVVLCDRSLKHRKVPNASVMLLGRMRRVLRRAGLRVDAPAMQVAPFDSYLGSMDDSVATSLQEWDDNSKALRELAHAKKMRSFLRADVIRDTMFASDPVLAARELKSLQQRSDFGPRWARALTEHPLGSPPLMSGYPLTSTNRVHKAHALATLEDETGRETARFSSYFEFGAGYGATLAIARALGFQGPAHLVDLPAFLALQQWYLDCTGVGGVTGYSAGGSSGLASYLDALRQREQDSLFISTWALSEAPIAVREEVLANLGCGFVFIAAQPTFGGIDNIEYFRARLATYGANHTWTTLSVLGLEGHCYFLGTPGRG
jgi:hypothetical protein